MRVLCNTEKEVFLRRINKLQMPLNPRINTSVWAHLCLLPSKLSLSKPNKHFLLPRILFIGSALNWLLTASQAPTNYLLNNGRKLQKKIGCCENKLEYLAQNSRDKCLPIAVDPNFHLKIFQLLDVRTSRMAIWAQHVVWYLFYDACSQFLVTDGETVEPSTEYCLWSPIEYWWWQWWNTTKGYLEL